MMPAVNSFLRKDDIPAEKSFDLSIGYCSRCHLVQLMRTIPPADLFRHYLYFSSVSDAFLKHCEKTASYLSSRLKLNSKSLVLEIASNDGAMLQYFQKMGIQVLGVDPAKNVAAVAVERGIPTIPEFFNQNLAEYLRTQKNIQADLVYGANVLAHVPEILNFLGGVNTILSPKGTAVFEFPYLEGLFDGKFDTIYHEHVFYYSLLALQNLFRRAGLELYDVEMTPMQGGSLLIFAAYPGVYPVSKRVTDMLIEEEKNGWNRAETYAKVDLAAQQIKEDLLMLLTELKKEGKSIAAFSAPAKGIVLMNYCGIGSNYLDFIVDSAKVKQGLYTPGNHLLIYPPEKIFEEKPDYLLILCWNIADSIMDKFKEFAKSGGKFIIPIPHVTVV